MSEIAVSDLPDIYSMDGAFLGFINTWTDLPILPFHGLDLLLF